MRHFSTTVTARSVLFLLILNVGGCTSEKQKLPEDFGIGDASTTDGPPACIPSCAGRTCGDDGCGGICDVCPTAQICDPIGGSCKREAELMVPLRDGVRLRTHVALPAGSGPFPVVLVRSPYWDLSGKVVIQWFGGLTDLGYAFVYQAARGTGGSEGTLTPLKQEFDDGEDAVSWIVAQPWSDGKIGTAGGSYEGFTAIAAASRSEHVKVVIADGFLSHAYGSWPISRNGALSWSLLWWLHLLETGEDKLADLESMTTVTNSRPVLGLDKALWGEEIPLWREVAPQMEANSAYWDDWSLEGKLDKLCTPMLLLQAATEWEDDVLDVYRTLMKGSCSAEAKADQRFVLHPYEHTGAVSDPFSDSKTAKLIRRYLEVFLKGASNTLSDTPAVQVSLQNGGWVSSERWPPTEGAHVLYLGAGAPHSLDGVMTAAPAQEHEDSYVFDPAKDDACSESYTGYRAFGSGALDQALEIAGIPEVSLRVRIDRPDTDLFVYLSEIDSAGNYKFITMGALRLRFRNSLRAPSLLTPGEAITVKIPMVAIGYRVSAGSRLDLLIASSECGHTENTNTGGSMMTDTSPLPAKVTIMSGSTSRSHISIPVVAN